MTNDSVRRLQPGTTVEIQFAGYETRHVGFFMYFHPLRRMYWIAAATKQGKPSASAGWLVEPEQIVRVIAVPGKRHGRRHR